MKPIASTLLSLYGGTPQHGEWLTACLQGAWSRLIGERAAKVCRPISMCRRELLVEVFDDTWMPALASMKQQLLDRIRTLAGDEIRHLTFVAKQP